MCETVWWAVICRYVCQRCGFEFERDKPGQVICGRCGYFYIDWLNFEEVLKSIRGKGDESIKKG